MRRAVLTLGGHRRGPRRAAVVQDARGRRRRRRARDDPGAFPDAQRVGARTATTATRPAAGASHAAAGTGQAAAAPRTVTGAVASTQYGPMQVQLTLAGQKITKVNVVQRTNEGSREQPNRLVRHPQAD